MKPLALLLTGSLLALQSAAPVTRAPAAAIAAGKPYWIDSEPDPAFALLNARVDIGTMRRIGDELEAVLAWPSSRGEILALRQAYPQAEIPDGSYEQTRERVICSPEGMISYAVSIRVFNPEGHLIFTHIYPAGGRAAAEAWDASHRSGNLLDGSYSANPRSLICWAASRKCQGQDLSWPPPPNQTPLENSERARRQMRAYNQRFIPSCRLKTP